MTCLVPLLTSTSGRCVEGTGGCASLPRARLWGLLAASGLPPIPTLSRAAESPALRGTGPPSDPALRTAAPALAVAFRGAQLAASIWKRGARWPALSSAVRAAF